jgi:zinc protease
VLVKRERAVPLVAFRAVYPGGVRYESESTNGLSALYSRVMTRGTATRSAMDIAREIDELAGSLHGNAGRSSLGLRGEFLASHFDRALRLFADCLTTPEFRPEQVERERTLQLLDIASRDDNPSGSAFDLFARTLYTRHPYRMDVLGEAPALASLTREHLEGMRALALDPSRLTLAIVGDVDEGRALSLCDDLFGKSGGPPPPAPAVQEEPPQASPRRSYRELEKAQAHLIYGFLGVTVDSPDRHALDVLSSALSGQGGRLFLELRDKRSLAYSISSFSVEGLDPGYFGIYMGTSPEKVGEALAGIVAELDRVVQSPLPEPEVHRARRYLIGTHAIGLQRNSARAAIIAFDECYGLGADAFARYEEQIQAVTQEKVLEIARRIIRPAQSNLAILGPRAADVGL